MTVRLLLVALVLSGWGCALFETEADIVTSGAWTGWFGNRSVSGTGDRTVLLIGGDCAVVSKAQAGGTLFVQIRGGEYAMTSAPYGSVSVCAGSPARGYY